MDVKRLPRIHSLPQQFDPLGVRGVHGPVPVSTRNRRWALLLVSFAFSAAALYLVFRDVSWPLLWQESRRVRLGVYAWTYPISALGFASLAWRIRVLAGTQTQLSFMTALRSVFAGYLGNAALPARVGEVLKAAYIARQARLPFGAALAWIAVERLVDLCCVLCCALWIVPWVMGKSAMGDGVMLFVVLAMVGMAAVVMATLRPVWFSKIVKMVLPLLGQRLSQWLDPKLESFLQGLGALARPRTALAMLLCTLVYWACTVATMQLWLQAFELSVPWYGSLLLLAFLALGTALPAAAAYIGTYHFAVVAALGVLGVARETGAALALFVHAAGLIPWVTVSILVLLPSILRGELVGQKAR